MSDSTIAKGLSAMHGQKLISTLKASVFAALLLGLSLAGGATAQETAINPKQVNEPLAPCIQVPAYIDAKAAAYTKQKEAAQKGIALTFDKDGLDTKFARYDKASCDKETGLPHLVVDGRLDHLGDFVIPGLLFLYIAGALGWAGRSYLMESSGPEDEIMIDLQRAIKCLLLSFLWPVTALPQLTGKMFEADDRITISPR
jgi:photosystem I subunit III